MFNLFLKYAIITFPYLVNFIVVLTIQKAKYIKIEFHTTEYTLYF